MNSILDRRSAYRTEFSNGYTASVVSYSDEYEVAVLYDGKPVYDTPVTFDVVRCENREQAEAVVDQIMELPPRNGVR